MEFESRRGRKKQRTRRGIFAAAMSMFGERGYPAVTIGQICRRADVARGTFFLHFPSKAALLLELDQQLAAELAERAVPPPGSAAGEYRTLVDWLGERFRPCPDLLLAVLAEGAPALRAGVERIVREGQRRGELRRNLSARLAAGMFLGATAEILAGRVFAPGEATHEQIRSQLLQALLHGLREPKPRLKWTPGLADGGT